MHLRACELCGMCMEPMDHMHPLGRTGGTAVGSQQVKVTPKTAFTSKCHDRSPRRYEVTEVHTQREMLAIFVYMTRGGNL